MSMDRPNLVRPVGLLLAAAGLALLSACSPQPPAATAAAAAATTSPGPADAEAPAPDQTGTAAPTGPAKEPATLPQPRLEPPDGKWLTDEQGRQYFLEQMPKVEGWYHWLDAEKTRVRLPYGMTYDVASQDEENFMVKVYKVEAGASAGPAPAPLPTPEQVAASYRNDTGKADRLTFEAFGRGLPTEGQWRNGFKIADMNGDGNPDIVHGPARKGGGRPIIFLGDGKGNWTRWSEVRFPRLAYDYGDVAVADFDGDGRLDIGMAMHLRGVAVLVADGPASFKEWGKGLDFSVAGNGGDDSGFTSRTLEAADWNGDGRPDLISVGEGPRMAAAPGQPRMGAGTAYGAVVYLNQGDGSWVRKDEIQAGSRHFAEDLAVADFTNDGHLDIVLASSVLDEKEILRVGAGGGDWTKAALPDLRSRGYIGAVDVADFNKDGRADLAVGYLMNELGVWRTGIDLFLGRADGSWERRGVAVEENRDWLTSLDSGDVDGDGNLDLAATTGDGEVWVFLGKGDGGFLREETPEIPAWEGNCRGYDIHLANLDGEPGDEMVAEFAGEPSALFAPTLCLNGGGMAAWKARAKK